MTHENNPKSQDDTSIFTTSHTLHPTDVYSPSFFYRHRKILSGTSIVIVLCMIIGTAAQYSLPGTLLYPIKSNFIEKTTTAFHVRSMAKANYQVTLMKERLAEAKKLAQADSVSEKALTDIKKQTALHTSVLFSTIETSIDSAFPKTDMLFTLNEFASVASALEMVTEPNKNLASFGDDVETIRQDSVRLYKTRVESFVATEVPATVYAYMTENLLQVQDLLNTQDLTTRTTRSAENYLDRVEPAITEKNLGKALLAIGEAYRTVQAAIYSGVIPEETTATSTDSGMLSTTTSSSSITISSSTKQ